MDCKDNTFLRNSNIITHFYYATNKSKSALTDYHYIYWK